MDRPAWVTILLGVVIVAAAAAYTIYIDLWIPENVLMLAGLYVLLAPRIHEYLSDRADEREYRQQQA